MASNALITVDTNGGLRFARLESSFLWWSNDDVIKWKLFRVTGPLWGNSIGHQRIPLKRPATRSFDSFFDLHLNKRLSKQSGRRFFRRHRAYGVTVMRGIKATQKTKFMGPTWVPPWSCRPQMGPMLAMNLAIRVRLKPDFCEGNDSCCLCEGVSELIHWRDLIS